MSIVLLLIREVGPEARWTFRLFPWPSAFNVHGLNEVGEARGVPLPDFTKLDRRMLAAHAGYTKRVNASGVIEISVTERAAEPLCAWIADALRAAAKQD